MGYLAWRIRRFQAAIQARRERRSVGKAHRVYGRAGSAFQREHDAVLAGKLAHLEAHGARDRLRRNIHRIEKGLLMRPRRDQFALGYIDETVDAYERLGDGPERVWATDVLAAYFDAVEGVEAARSRFEACRRDGDGQEIPTPRGNAPPPVDFADFEALMRRRRSIRWFTDAPVSRDAIDQAVLAAAQAPSACNRQPFRFHFFDARKDIDRIAAIPMGTRGFAHQIPVLGVLVGRLDAFFDERDRHLIYIDGSLAAMAFMLGLETQGLASCPLNWPDLDAKEQAMAKELDLAPYERPIMLFAIGHADPEGLVAASTKRPLEDLRTWP